MIGGDNGMGGIGRIAAAMCGRLFALIASQNKKQREGLALSAVTDFACPAIVSFTSSPESLWSAAARSQLFVPPALVYRYLNTGNRWADGVVWRGS